MTQFEQRANAIATKRAEKIATLTQQVLANIYPEMNAHDAPWVKNLDLSGLTAAEVVELDAALNREVGNSYTATITKIDTLQAECASRQGANFYPTHVVTVSNTEPTYYFDEI